MLNAVHHIAIICSDYERSKHFYVDVLGLTVVREIYRAERQSYKLDLALHGRFVLEIFSFANPPKRVSAPEAAGAAIAVGAGAGAAGVAVCANEVNDKASIAAKLKIKLLEIELWLPTFFILLY